MCTIEIKHHSANQGSAGPLITALTRDFHRARPRVSLMQIGIYTVVTNISPPKPLPFPSGIYRFLKIYCTGMLPPIFLPGDNLLGQSKSINWLHLSSKGATADSSFSMTGAGTVSGYIEYFVGMLIDLNSTGTGPAEDL